MSTPDRTVRLHRVIKAKPKVVFHAFTNGPANAKWLPPKGYTCTVHHIDPNAGGTFRMTFHSISNPDENHTFQGTYLEIIENKLIRNSDQFEEPNLPGTMETKIEFTEVESGTELRITQEGMPSELPLDMCYLGWQDSLNQLADLVEQRA